MPILRILYVHKLLYFLFVRSYLFFFAIPRASLGLQWLVKLSIYGYFFVGTCRPDLFALVPDLLQ